ncbi:MAG: hypothetical protein KGZ25_09675, partial [Planctomycetes bacterium]|nr:hypothetical protein [Planctomycetota bacterium]
RPAQFDTRRRRNDGTELIVTDMMYQANGSGSHAPSNTQWSSGIPYFNPHVEYCARAVPEGTGHQLTADNAVRSVQFSETTILRGVWGNRGGHPLAVHEKIGPDASLTDGPYYAYRD